MLHVISNCCLISGLVKGLEVRNDNVVRARANVIKTLATVSLFFILCWSWNQTYYLMFYLGYQHVDFTSAFYNFTVIMVFLNCCVNPIIYSVRYDQVRGISLTIFSAERKLNDGSGTNGQLKNVHVTFGHRYTEQ